MHCRAKKRKVTLSVDKVIGNEVQADDYSSGESEVEDDFGMKTEEQQIQRIAELWCNAIAKARGAA